MFNFYIFFLLKVFENRIPADLFCSTHLKLQHKNLLSDFHSTVICPPRYLEITEVEIQHLQRTTMRKDANFFYQFPLDVPPDNLYNIKLEIRFATKIPKNNKFTCHLKISVPQWKVYWIEVKEI